MLPTQSTNGKQSRLRKRYRKRNFIYIVKDYLGETAWYSFNKAIDQAIKNGAYDRVEAEAQVTRVRIMDPKRVEKEEDNVH